jgi:hypothetical protein
MGNQISQARGENNNELKPKSLSQILDYVSTYYILTMDFKSLKNLYKKEYCDNLVVLTSEVIQRYFTDLEITYLAQRIKNGVEVNELEKDKVIFFDRDQLNTLDVQNSIKKKRICNSIAKFYIKIAHIFSAIVTTINPIYTYKDEYGNTLKANLSQKVNIPENVPRTIIKLNICENRINALKNNQTIEPDFNGDITIGPKLCDMNIGIDGHEKMLSDEPGIDELEELYYDDDYDFETGTFKGMSEKTRKTYENDLKIFYGVFSGEPNMPSNISKFSDIKLREYNKLEKCQGSNPLFDRNVKGPITNKLFAKYAENLKTMIYNANKNQNALLEVVNKIFVYTIDPQTKKKQIRISPDLTEKKLTDLVTETRAMIIKLYLKCEIDYVNGLKIYEAIVEQKIFETAKNQIEKLENMTDDILAMGDEQPPESLSDDEHPDEVQEQPNEVQETNEPEKPDEGQEPKQPEQEEPKQPEQEEPKQLIENTESILDIDKPVANGPPDLQFAPKPPIEPSNNLAKPPDEEIKEPSDLIKPLNEQTKMPEGPVMPQQGEPLPEVLKAPEPQDVPPQVVQPEVPKAPEPQEVPPQVVQPEIPKAPEPQEVPQQVVPPQVVQPEIPKAPEPQVKFNAPQPVPPQVAQPEIPKAPEPQVKFNTPQPVPLQQPMKNMYIPPKPKNVI